MMAKKRRVVSRRRRVVSRSKLAGFTRVKGKYALVFKKGQKLSLGKGRYASKASLMTNARKYFKK
jgi:hypothetical protein